MAALTGILETSLYVDDLDRAMRFYEDLFGFSLLVGDQRLRAMKIREGQVLLLFKRGASLSPEHFPPHDGQGPLHLAFAIPAEELAAWEERLKRHGIAIEEKKWEQGGCSLYFRDPDGHLLELATPGVWPNY
jgi:catechol 2,3-dioxygenase-like lactoylglutathione lyase family enzyme